MKPLEGITILDLSRVLACPFATMILAELGARVIKVEQPKSGDETRTFEPQLARDSAYYFVCNRSKESITVNLRTDEGRKLVRELAQKADVLVENFPVGTLGKFALDYASLAAISPRLIYVSCTGFGQSGPYRDFKTWGPNLSALAGLDHLTGWEDRPPSGMGGIRVSQTAGARPGTVASFCRKSNRADCSRRDSRPVRQKTLYH